MGNVLVAKGLGCVASKEMVEQIAKTEAEEKAALAAAKDGATKTKAELQQRYAKGGIVFEVQVAKDGSIATVGSEEVAAELSRTGSRCARVTWRWLTSQSWVPLRSPRCICILRWR